MTHSEMIPYHNTHIKFYDGTSSRSGVLWATQGPHHRDIYTFVPSGNLIEWKKADQEDDNVKKYKLESKVDINTITWARHVLH